MHVIAARNVNYALELGVKYLREWGVRRDSRNGPVLVALTPVTTVYKRPAERVLFSAERDANPFFHLVESLWMLAGRNDLATLTPYVTRMKEFSDDGGLTQPGAYGKRWRTWFVEDSFTHAYRDQLSWAIRRLKADPNDRRVVIQMYDANFDQDAADNNGKDVPCNIVCAPWIDVHGRLSMTIFCRSNDIIWGAYGANAVHFSVMQEYLAAGVGAPLGWMYQVSNNYHAYLATIDKVAGVPIDEDPYSTTAFFSFPMFQPEERLREFDEDLTLFFDAPTTVGLRSLFLRRVACPLVMAHRAFKKKDFGAAFDAIEQCQAGDWREAARNWLTKHSKQKEAS